MSSAAAPSDLEASGLLQNLSLDTPNKSLQVPEAMKKTSAVQYGPVDMVGNGVNMPVERSISPFMDPNLFYHPSTPFRPDLMDPSLFYNPSGYPSHTYFYGANEWERYVGPDGTEVSPAVYGDYQQSYGYMPYTTYAPSGSAVENDGQLYAAQHYQYPMSYFQPSATNGSYTPNQTTPQAEISPPVGSNQLQLPVDTAKGNHGSGIMTNRTNISKPFSSNYQNPSLKSNDFYGSGGSLPAVLQGGHTSSGRNQNRRPFSNSTGFQHTRATSGLEQARFGNKMYPNNRLYGQYANLYGSGPGFMSSNYYPRINDRGWSTIDNRYKSRSRGNGGYNTGGVMDGLNELNKGPRTKVYQKDSESDRLGEKGQSPPPGEKSIEEAVTIFPGKEQCNKDDFPESYGDAKFFVIKSYSEDDVHKSIKYGVWTSTANGNKKLDAAYKEAQSSGGCPVFLLFSVNASGQFVGLAEMLGPVEFEKTVDYWQQDKWNGCFPVKWHIIKDVPNSMLRHIKLEYNENKPVTNSRDTQEVKLEQGLQLLQIFKSHSSKTCILDDFEFYESREKVMQEKKSRQRQSNKQDVVSAEHAAKEESSVEHPSDRFSRLVSDVTEDAIAPVSAESELGKKD